MTHYYHCNVYGKSWTDEEAALLPQSDSSTPKPVCCGIPISSESYKVPNLNSFLRNAAAEACGEDWED